MSKSTARPIMQSIGINAPYCTIANFVLRITAVIATITFTP